MTTLLEFAISTEYRFDTATGRYRYRDSGKFAPRGAVLNLTRQTISAQSAELIGLGDRLSSGKISLKEFQQQAGELVRQIHIGQTTIGRGGLDKVTSADWLKTARLLKQQYYSGLDKKTGTKYGLKHLAEQIKNGEVSPAQLRNRLNMYANAGMISYWIAWRQTEKDAGRSYGIRQLGPTDNSCPDCVAYSKMGPKKIEDVPPPKTLCQCRANCLCTLVSLTLEQAVKRGMKRSAA